MSAGRLIVRSFLIAAFLRPVVVAALAEGVGAAQSAAPAPAAEVVRVPSPPGLGPELVEYRSQKSRTFAALGDGAYRTQLSQSSLNYRGSDGSWLPIDNTFVPAAGGGYVNAANSLRYELPAR